MDLRDKFMLMMVMLTLLYNNVEMSKEVSCSLKCILKEDHCESKHGCDKPWKDINDLKEVTAYFECGSLCARLREKCKSKCWM